MFPMEKLKHLHERERWLDLVIIKVLALFNAKEKHSLAVNIYETCTYERANHQMAAEDTLLAHKQIPLNT